MTGFHFFFKLKHNQRLNKYYENILLDMFVPRKLKENDFLNIRNYSYLTHIFKFLTLQMLKS